MPLHNKSLAALPLAIALAIPTLAQAAEQGFLEDSHLELTNRNFYFSQDFRNGDFAVTPDGKRQSRHAEWAHGVIANFESGFTQGTVGVGVDAHGLWAVKLDGGNGLVGDGRGIPGLVSRDNDGEPTFSVKVYMSCPHLPTPPSTPSRPPLPPAPAANSSSWSTTPTARTKTI